MRRIASPPGLLPGFVELPTWLEVKVPMITKVQAIRLATNISCAGQNPIMLCALNKQNGIGSYSE